MSHIAKVHTDELLGSVKGSASAVSAVNQLAKAPDDGILGYVEDVADAVGSMIALFSTMPNRQGDDVTHGRILGSFLLEERATVREIGEVTRMILRTKRFFPTSVDVLEALADIRRQNDRLEMLDYVSFEDVNGLGFTGPVEMIDFVRYFPEGTYMERRRLQREERRELPEQAEVAG